MGISKKFYSQNIVSIFVIVYCDILFILVSFEYPYFRDLIDTTLPKVVDDKVELKPALEIFNAAREFLFIWKKNRDVSRFESLCRYIVLSLESPSKDLSYAGIILVKEKALQWIAHIKKLLKICCNILETLSPEAPSDTKLILVYLHTLIAFTGTRTWQFLNNNKFDVVKSGMNKICSNIIDYIVAEGLYKTLKVINTFSLFVHYMIVKFNLYLTIFYIIRCYF